MLRTRILRLALPLASLVLFSAGCSSDTSPTAAAVTQNEDGRTFVSFSSDALVHAGKVAAIPFAEGETVSELFTAKGGGKLGFADDNRSGSGDDVGVTFRVSRKALDADVTIHMTVYGNTMSNLVVAFEPGGLIFREDAELEIQLGADLIDLDTKSIVVHHTYNDGTVEEAVVYSSEYSEKAFKIKVAVPGFSRYSLGN